MKAFGAGLLMVATFVSVVFLIYRVWTLGDAEDDYSVVCLGGHEYWRANFAAKGFLAIKLSDDGLPVRCEK